MSSTSDVMNLSEGKTNSPASSRATQPFLWSVRRELWEYRSIWIAPSVAAALVLFGFALRTVKLPHLIHAAEKLPPMAQNVAMAAPFAIASGTIMFTGLIVSVFYCLGALNNERRDRSILFWKSLPVSDVMTVLSKAFIPFVAVPLTVFAIAFITQVIMLLLGSAILLVDGLSPATLWMHWPLPKMTAVMLYFVAVNVLWYAPIYGWLLMVSSWARRMAFLWAVLPWLGLAVLEKIALDSSHVWSFLTYRLNGAVREGLIFTPTPHKSIDVLEPLKLLTPAHFLSTPGLWLGLLAGAIFIAAAIWFRRMREPG